MDLPAKRVTNLAPIDVNHESKSEEMNLDTESGVLHQLRLELISSLTKRHEEHFLDAINAVRKNKKKDLGSEILSPSFELEASSNAPNALDFDQKIDELLLNNIVDQNTKSRFIDHAIDLACPKIVQELLVVCLLKILIFLCLFNLSEIMS